jgi:hypothetical protein
MSAPVRGARGAERENRARAPGLAWEIHPGLSSIFGDEPEAAAS